MHIITGDRTFKKLNITKKLKKEWDIHTSVLTRDLGGGLKPYTNASIVFCCSPVYMKKQK